MSMIKEYFFNEINKGQILSREIEQEPKPKDVDCSTCVRSLPKHSKKICAHCWNFNHHKAIND
jgi:hypothetical protein